MVMIKSKMVIPLNRTFPIFIVLVYCYCIPPEYYLARDDNNNDDSETVYNETIGRKSYNISNDKDMDTSEESDDDYSFDLKLKPIHFEESTEVSSENKTAGKEYDDNKSSTEALLRENNNETDYDTTTPFNIFQDYHYMYDYNYEDMDSIMHKFDDNSSIVPENFNATTSREGLTLYDNKSIRYLADFYNLEPAVSKIKLKNRYYKSNSDNNVWYVPQNHPCWELPILYGELGKKVNTSDIFVVFAGMLKNVVEASTTSSVPRKYFVPHMSNNVNKWCSEAPCYGDHTLCLFPDRGFSTICGPNYEVKPPTTIVQIALVNTLNSIRNRIANGYSAIYPNLPSAANMKQIIYDYDLEAMAVVWLRQCLPGAAPCTSLENNLVTMLECTKYAQNCCYKSKFKGKMSTCIPQYECFILPVIGCLHAWFWSAKGNLNETDIDCGHISYNTFNTIQLLWAETKKIGCGFATQDNGDVRVICNFTPGAPFHLDSKYFCGLILHKDVTQNYSIPAIDDITDVEYLAQMGINLKYVKHINDNYTYHKEQYNTNNWSTLPLSNSYLDVMSRIYKSGWVRDQLEENINGTVAMTTRLTIRYKFVEEGEGKCDTNEPIYIQGEAGSLCIEKGLRFGSLCYDFGDPTSNYRLFAIVAPIVLFVLILYDLFSSVVRQTNY